MLSRPQRIRRGFQRLGLFLAAILLTIGLVLMAFDVAASMCGTFDERIFRRQASISDWEPSVSSLLAWLCGRRFVA